MLLPMPVVRVFAADGSERPRLTVPTALGLSTLVFVDTLNMLLFTTANTLIAFDIDSQTIRWQTKTATGRGIVYKPSVLSTCGICIITTWENNEVHVYSLNDGTLRSKFRLTDFCGTHTCDSATSTWYAKMSGVIASFRWDGTKLVADRTKQISEAVHTITVIPPTPGRHTSYLVGTYCKAEFNTVLHVYSLPDLRLVCSHITPRVYENRVFADPSGTSIAMLNFVGAGNSISILPWPLSGMPALE